jgi:hypothetical protein
MELLRSVTGAGRNNPSSGREGRGEPLAREEDDAVETLVSDGSHAAFRVGVGIGGLAGRSGGSCSGMSIAATTRPPAFWKSLVQGAALDCGRTSGCPPDPHGAASPGGAVAASVRGKRSTEERPLAAPTKGLLANGRESRRSPALAARFPGGIQDPVTSPRIISHSAADRTPSPRSARSGHRVR